MEPSVTANRLSTKTYQLFSDYHSHPQGHRVQWYTQALLQPWADSARRSGLTDIAFTDHDRYHAGIDFDEIDRLREKNPDLRIRAGIELDNDPVHSGAGRNWIEKHWDKLDFVLGSVHFLDRADEMFDSVPDGAAQFEGRKVDAIYADYFRRVREIAASNAIAQGGAVVSRSTRRLRFATAAALQSRGVLRDVGKFPVRILRSGCRQMPRHSVRHPDGV